jgi:hypothetical protein
MPRLRPGHPHYSLTTSRQLVPSHEATQSSTADRYHAYANTMFVN